MYVSIFELFKIGLGPSSSHTVGPMKAARRFVERLISEKYFDQVAQVKTTLYGSLAHTGKGHGSDIAIFMGLEGNLPESIQTDLIAQRVEEIKLQQKLNLGAEDLVKEISFKPTDDLLFNRKQLLPLHSNGMKFQAFDAQNQLLLEKIYYSVGGGFIVNSDGISDSALIGDHPSQSSPAPYPFDSAKELLQQCKEHGLSISGLMLANEASLMPLAQVKTKILHLWKTMEACIQKGCIQEGILPGGLKVKRRAATMFRKLKVDNNTNDPLQAMDWVNLWALAVNEENAAGGRVVTAPTNGAAGIIPAVLKYYHHFIPNADDEGTIRFLLAATAIGSLYKKNASISGAEVGCQGEVGVACSMAAGALAEVLGGSPEQVENAAEIGMEHNLGLTCDPIGGLVQVPCIERNAMGSIKAINAARLALSGDGSHKVSLDKVIATMRATGADMSHKYKETARGGLALNIIEC
jgi:L-serine dehydratase